MLDILNSVQAMMHVANKIKEISDKTKDAEFKAACQEFFERIDEHVTALRSLLTENFQAINA